MNPTARDISIRTPCVLPADCSVADVRTHLVRDHVHLALLVDPAGRLVGTLTRDDIDGVDGARPAAGHGRLEDRVVPPEMTESEVRERLARLGVRRAAVVDEDGRLVGLVCAKRSGNGYCTDDGIAQRRLERG
jgi:CBS domain-containing protein